jgi:ABC-2 type transport system permease protein
VTLRPFVVAWKELLQLRRDRMTLAMMIVLPLVQLLLFGYAINTDVRHMPTLVYDQDRSAASRDFAAGMVATGFYDVVGEARSYADIEVALRRGTARVALVVPPRYGANLVAGKPAQLELIVDGSDPQTVASATNTASAMALARSSELLLARVTKSVAPGFEPIGLEPNTWYNPELRTAVFVVPGLVGVILTMTMVMLTAMAVARERERGTLEQLIVSPVRPVELVLGKIAPYVIMGYVQMTVILVAGQLMFHVPFRGSIALLYALAFVFIAANLAIGLFFSTLAQNQQQAMQMSFFFLLPNIVLSGFMFPFEGIPLPAQIPAQALPLTHFLRIVRSIVLKGGGFDDVYAEFLWLSGILVALVIMSSLRFRKKLI